MNVKSKWDYKLGLLFLESLHVFLGTIEFPLGLVFMRYDIALLRIRHVFLDPFMGQSLMGGGSVVGVLLQHAFEEVGGLFVPKGRYSEVKATIPSSESLILISSKL